MRLFVVFNTNLFADFNRKDPTCAILCDVKKVIVCLSSDSNAMRECFIGIFNYVNAGHAWEVKVIPDPHGTTAGGLRPETIDAALREGVNGVITGLGIHTPGFKRLVESGIPLVLNNAPPDWTPAPGAPIAVLHNNDLAIGRMGAKYLCSKGNFRSYGFLPAEKKCFWSTHRRRGFALELANWRISPSAFHRDRESLEDWIRALPKPTAILAVSDSEAVNVIEVCKRLKLKVPEQVALLGVNNDEIYCKASRPQLSSIHPNHVELGRRAAVELDRLMRGRPPRQDILIPPIGLVERGSTRTIPPAGHLIRFALGFIQSHYQEGITARDVAEHLGVSLSLLRMRFQTIHGKSLRDCILDTRLEAAKKLLGTTSKPITQIAEETGFSSICRFSHFFEDRLGVSPQGWRQSNRTSG